MGFLGHVLSLLVAISAIGFFFFANYPPPPQSPILYQWQLPGKYHEIQDRFRVFYKDEEGELKTKNATLLLLHGFPTSSFDYYKIWPHLRQNFSRILALDFLGMGFSDKPRHHKYSIFEQADIVENLLDHLNITEVHLLTHDYGDTVAQELMARFKEGSTLGPRILTICMMNGGVFPSKHQPILIQRILRWPILGTILGKMSNYYMFRVNLGKVFGSEQPTEAEYHDFWSVVRYNEGHRVMGDLLDYIRERYENEERWVDALRHSPCPLNFIYGPRDPVNPPPFDDYFRQLIPNANIDVLDSEVGHYPQLEAPQETAHFYSKFLQEYL
jgi:pimeloyl-ACP methyl ester carboxylesterase